jgi:ubiquitin-conjugating enzyme E2 I
MDNSAEARLKTEWDLVREAMGEEKLPFIKAKLRRENKVINYFVWDVELQGRPGTSWQGGVYKGVLTFGKNYPTEKPVFTFSKVFDANKKEVRFRHMNVSNGGSVCVDILRDDKVYNSTKSVVSILMAVEALLYDPNPGSPYDGELAKLFKANKPEYEKLILEFAKICTPTD